ncbi:L,D-transpeptidase family protein [Microbacterium sp. QXD-8]|uniref:L,D-transpeptidase family protein n=1 Tax=Microbacterium psychrotolerans TaxID=3068321 RepID=A0ABU0Z214_9MICO|nr:L,D-transpeptidase family protein [Microbacterium sp. QXD-8]MDQ7878622.1 L,D-transpeptidase family protein [Microbacterium sp. QXD-8]
MTDLATQPHAGKASGDDAVEGEQGVDSEATATADSAPSSAMDEKDAVTQSDVVTEDVVAPAAGSEDSAAGEADSAEAQETDAVAEAQDADGEAPEADGEVLEPDVPEAQETDAETDLPEAADETEAPEADAETAPAGPEAETDVSDEVEPTTDAEPEDDSTIELASAREAEVATDTAADTAVHSGADLETVAVATAVLAPPAVTPSPATTPTETAADGSVYAWAPEEPKAKKKHTALWISAAAGVAVVGLVVSSLVLIAPGTAVAGVPVGWLTPGAAAEAIEQRLAETTVVLTGTGEDAELTGAELGATVDAQALADAAFAAHPMWNPTAWFATTDAEIELEASAASDALRDAAPQLYTDPVDATLAFDPATASYVATPAVEGVGIDVATVQAAIQAAFEAGQTRVEVDPVTAAIPAEISTETADATVAQLNGMLDTAGFYVGDERTVPIDRAVAASWLSIAPEGDEFAITADPAAIQPVVDTLAPAVDRAPENAVVITDTGGKVLQTMAAGQSGRQLGDTAGIAAAFADQLASGDAVYKLPVDEVPVSTTTLARNIVVDLSEQRTYIYENGQVVNSFLISSGTAATPTHTGSFRINSHVRVQDMGALCYNPNAVNSYCTEDVPWVMYFNGDQGFHGTYWHSNFGNRMSHGCVNLPLGTAEFLYSWAPNGTEVRVQS